MEIKVSHRNISTSGKKLAIFQRILKGKQLIPSLNMLRFQPSPAARYYFKLLTSAKAIAKEKGIDEDKLKVTLINLGQGKSLRRLKLRSKGRADVIHKRASHLTIVVEAPEKKKEK